MSYQIRARGLANPLRAPVLNFLPHRRRLLNQAGVAAGLRAVRNRVTVDLFRH